MAFPLFLLVGAALVPVGKPFFIQDGCGGLLGAVGLGLGLLLLLVVLGFVHFKERVFFRLLLEIGLELHGGHAKDFQRQRDVGRQHEPLLMSLFGLESHVERCCEVCFTIAHSMPIYNQDNTNNRGHFYFLLSLMDEKIE